MTRKSSAMIRKSSAMIRKSSSMIRKKQEKFWNKNSEVWLVRWHELLQRWKKQEKIVIGKAEWPVLTHFHLIAPMHLCFTLVSCFFLWCTLVMILFSASSPFLNIEQPALQECIWSRESGIVAIHGNYIKKKVQLELAKAFTWWSSL